LKFDFKGKVNRLVNEFLELKLHFINKVKSFKKLSLKFIFFLSIYLFFFIQTSYLFSIEPIPIHPNLKQISIGRSLEIFEDPSGQLSLEDLSSPESNVKFVASTQDIPNFGMTNITYWFRFILENQSSEKTEVALEVGFSRLEDVQFFIPSQTGEYFKKQAGTNYPFNQREVHHRNHVFRIPLEPNKKNEYYLRIASRNSAVQAPLILYSPDHLIKTQVAENTALGIMIGILLSMLVYNLFIYLSLRDSSYIYYVLSLAVSTPLSMDLEGLTAQYIWTDTPVWALYVFPACHGLYFVSLIRFGQIFLNTSSYLPKVNKLLNIAIVLWFIVFVLGTLFPNPKIAAIRNNFSISSSLFLLITGIMCWKSGYRPARLYVLASTVFLIGIILLAMERLGGLPRSFITSHAWQIGSILEMLLLSLALADKINFLKQRHLDDQEKMLQIKEDANAQLEMKVVQRTRAIEQSPVSIVITDTNGRIEYVNPKFTQLSGYTFEEVSGQTSNFLKSGNTPPETYRELWNTIIAGKEWYGVFNNRKKNGELYWEQASISPIFDQHGKITHFVSVKEDITSRLKTEKELHQEKEKADHLLHNILPEEVALELKERGYATPKYYSQVTVLFTDFKDFTLLSEQMTPIELMIELNDFFATFDEIVEKHNLEKIKTIGDAYMAVGGLPTPYQTHATNAVTAALEMQQYIKLRNSHNALVGRPKWDLRIGLHLGPVIAGVVGKKKFAYDIWGDTVNLAARMESSGEVGRVNISGTVYAQVKDQFHCKFRGKISVKNKGELEMYFVEEFSDSL
jgi:PAS domain S-box-containing protein